MGAKERPGRQENRDSKEPSEGRVSQGGAGEWVRSAAGAENVQTEGVTGSPILGVKGDLNKGLFNG